jgi:hypothetical protein
MNAEIDVKEKECHNKIAVFNWVFDLSSSTICIEVALSDSEPFTKSAIYSVYGSRAINQHQPMSRGIENMVTGLAGPRRTLNITDTSELS